jgi:hypothetical protein
MNSYVMKFGNLKNYIYRTGGLAWEQIDFGRSSERKEDVGGEVMKTGNLILLANPIWQKLGCAGY